MQKITNLFQVAVFTAFLSCFACGGALTKDEERNMIYEAWKLPSQFTLPRMQRLLTEFSNETFQKAFRYIGIEEDFFHGHLLFEKVGNGENALLYPRAILYHTQEEAHKAHWEKTIDPKFDYLNVTTRNWIQWLSDHDPEDGEKIENAKQYLDITQRDPKQFEVEFAEPQKELHYTIHARMLDPHKLGFILAGELQFEFQLENNKENEPYYSKLGERGPITITLPNGEEIKLSLTTQTMFIERGNP